LSDAEKRGLSIVQSKCAKCHSGELFTDQLYHNNGLDADFSNTSFEGIFLGRYRVSYNPFELGAYRTPTLRNIMITAPYMHDGRFQNIDEVLNHYTTGVKKSPSLAFELINEDGSTGFSLSEENKKDIKAFLQTLTDSTFLTSF
jgi:cytochrome c peroxidase